MRRLLTSLLAGTLALFVAAGQAGASAVDPVVLDQAMTQVAESSAIAVGLLAQVEQDGFDAPGLDRAYDAVTTMVAQYSEESLPGLGPVTAEAVLAALLAGDLPPINDDGLAATLTEIEDAADAMSDDPTDSDDGTDSDDPGASEWAPGQSEENLPPGQGGVPPGQQDKDAEEPEEDLPGASEETPAATRPTNPVKDE